MTLIKHLFSSPLIIERFQPESSFNQALFDICEKAYHASAKDLTDKAWDDYNIFDWNFPEIKMLRSMFIQTASLFAKQMWNTDLPEQGFGIKGWANYREPNSFHGPHYHARVHLASTYYVQVAKKGGAICFFDPRGAAPFCDLWGPNEWHLYPKESMMVAFPAYLQHMVAPSQEGVRLSISCNILFPQDLRAFIPEDQQSMLFD